MANERNTENLVRKLLLEQGYANNENIVIEEQSSKNPKINKLLSTASKSGNGKGYPEFIITFKNDPTTLAVVECKANVKYHQSKNKDKPVQYAVDGVLLYASYLKDDFNVIAIAVSGENDREIKISHHLWMKQKYTYIDVTDKNFLDPNSLFKIIERQSKPLEEEELVTKAIDYNYILHQQSIPEIDRCTIISAILVALQDRVFANSYNNFHSDEDAPDYNPNEHLINSLLDACSRVLERNDITQDKQKVVLREYEKLKSIQTLSSRNITANRKKEIKNVVLRDLIHDVMSNIMPYINNNVYDVLGKFYTQFIRYAGSDSKTGLVLTPPHIADFFCDIAAINENDVVYDPCCGTGGFLVAAMNRMLNKANNDIEKHSKIKSEQLIGVEKRADMFSHACSNMMMRGDGKSHVYYGDCFSEPLKDIIANKKITKVFLNPPYDVGPAGQLEFIENAMESLSMNGLCVAICQMSTCTDIGAATTKVKERLLKMHTLKAVFSMPDDLFYPVSVVTSILVFQAHSPHAENHKTFFGYFKDDGFIKIKNSGRTNKGNKWGDIKNRWINAFHNKENISGLTVMQSVSEKDEWCAEAYMETDYSTLEESNFLKTVKNYIAFQFLQDKLNIQDFIKLGITDKNCKKDKDSILNLETHKWKKFMLSDVFEIKKGYYNKKPPESAIGDIPFIGASDSNNGLTSYHLYEDVKDYSKNGSINKNEDVKRKIYPGKCVTVSNNGSVGEAFYQPDQFICSHDINPLYLKDKKINFDQYIGLFLCTLIKLDKYRWSYGRKWRPMRMINSHIFLPVTNQGDPDWDYMRDYIKALPI